MRPPLIRDEGDIILITLDDPATVNEGQALGIRQVLYDRIEASELPLVAVDLGALDYLSSSGIALLIGLKRRAEARGGRLALFHLRAEIFELFSVMRLTNLFAILPDRDQAFNLLRSQPVD